MPCAKKSLILLMVASMGIWGCAKSPNHGIAKRNKVQMLEQKNAKLEDDFRTAAAVRDQLRRRLADAQANQQELQSRLESEQQELQARLEVQLQSLLQERNELHDRVEQTNDERDQLANQFNEFRKGVRDLLGQAEAAATPEAPPVTSSVEVSEPAAGS